MKEKKEKSPAKFLGAIGMTKGLLGGVRDVIQNKKAATAAGQDYSFKQGMGDFAVGGLNQVLGPNRAGTPTREFQQPNMEFPGQMSAQQMEQFQKMFQMAQNMQSPAQMKGESPMRSGPSTEAAQRRKEARDKAMGDNTTTKKGIGRAIEKIKDRNDIVSYTYENERGGTTGVTTTKKKVRKEQRKSDQPKTKETKSSTKNTKGKTYKIKSRKPKGIYLDGKGNSLSLRKQNKRKKKLYKSR